jgi:hypothetical protein
VTPESNNGRPPASRTGARQTNGNGRVKTNADQGDLWSDAPAKPAAAPTPPEAVVEKRRPVVPAAAAPMPEAPPEAPTESPVESQDADITGPQDAEEALDLDLEPGDEDLDDALEESTAPPARNGRIRASPAALAGAMPEAGIDARPNLLDTAPLAMPAAEPDIDDDYDDDEYEDDYGEGYYYRHDDMSLLRNPYVLAGLAVALAIILAVAVVFLFGRGGEGSGGSNNGGAAGQTQTPRPSGGNAIPGAVNAKSIATSTVREGPDREYLEIGVLRSDQDVQVVGKNDDGSWYQIVYPRDSQLRGWVPKSALSVPETALASLTVVTATPIDRPTVIIPTSTPRPPDPTVTPEPTNTANQQADIAVIIAADCTPNSVISLAIRNAGSVPIDHNIQVIVANNGRVEYDELFDAQLAPGQVVGLNTGVRAKAPSMTATVLLQGLQDVSAVNNIASCSVSGGGGGGGGTNSGGTNVPPPVGTPAN